VRPIRLTLEGFGAFREPTEVDFDGVELFALVGPTGSGKSTIIDAMCFALYGTVPRYDDRRKVGEAITTGARQARVCLELEVGGRRYAATRVVRRTKDQVATREARLEEIGGEVLAGAAREMDPAVQRLLGLSFEHFTRAVVLPQGEFARFLHDKPADRQDLLVRLLGFGVYERMMRRANVRAAEGEAARHQAQTRIEALADCTVDAVAVWRGWVEHYAELRTEVRTAREDLAARERAAAEADAVAARQRAVLDALRNVDYPDAVARAGDERAVAAEALARAEQDAAARSRALEQARAARAELGARDPLVSWAQDHRDLGVLHERIEQARGAVAKRVAAAERTATARDAQQEVVEALRADHAVHALLPRLRAGAPCPLCEQPVTTVPSHPEPAEWGDARTTLTRAVAAATKATEALAAARQSQSDLDARAAELGARLAGAPAPEAIAARLAAVDAATETVEQATKADQTARAAVDKARRGCDRVDARLASAARAFREQRDALVSAGVEVPGERGVLTEDWSALAGWAASRLEPESTALQHAEAQAHAERDARDERRKMLVARAVESEIELAPGADVDAVLEAVVAAEQAAAAEVTRLQAGVTERAALEEQVVGAGAEIAVAQELGRLLDASHFERWLVVEALELLVEGASARLRELSGGQYSLAFTEGRTEFQVIDHANADEARSVRTLSGGETFQASLALALALADQLGELAADGAARLESIYLDEGFGTLDPDTLETVAGTIEQLGAGRRMVGVVTHVRELAERMPVAFRVTKGPRGSTVTRVEQGAELGG